MRTDAIGDFTSVNSLKHIWRQKIFSVLTDECEYDGRCDVGNEDDDETGEDGEGDGLLGIVGLLTSGRNDVEPYEGIEAGCSSCEHLQQSRQQTWFIKSLYKQLKEVFFFFFLR